MNNQAAENQVSHGASPFEDASCPRLRADSFLNGAERLVGMGFRCWISGYQTCDIRYWENGWNLFARELGPEQAKAVVTELTGWARSICCHAERQISVCPLSKGDFCRDECIAVSLIAACQHKSCPALQACATALLGVTPAEPVVQTSTRFAHALDAVQVSLPGNAICYRHDVAN